MKEVFNTYDEAYQYAMTVKWKTTTCKQGKDCWCRSIVPAKIIKYFDQETKEIENLFIVGTGVLDAETARYFVKLQNKKIERENMNRFKFVEETCDAVDTFVYGGDTLADKDTREKFKACLKKWSKEVIKWEDFASREMNDA